MKYSSKFFLSIVTSTLIASQYICAEPVSKASGLVVNPIIRSADSTLGSVVGAWFKSAEISVGSTKASTKPKINFKDGGEIGVVFKLSKVDTQGENEKTIPVDGKTLPKLQSRDNFKIAFGTNLPGLVFIENVDATKKRFDLGVYDVKSEKDNFLPPESTKFMTLDDTAGIEAYNIYFYACNQPQLESIEKVMSDSLPVCPNKEAFLADINSTKADKKARKLIAGKLSYPTENGTLSSAPYKKGSFLISTFQIDHTK